MKKLNSLRGSSGDAVALTLVKLMTMVLSLAVTRLLSEHLSVHDYGTYSQVLLVVSTVSSLTILGMMDGVNFFYGSQQDPDRRESYLTTLFTLQSLMGILSGAAVMACSGLICRYFGNPDVKGLLIFGAVLPLLQNLLSMTQILLVSIGKARLLAIRNLAVSLVRLGVVLLVVLAVRDLGVILATTAVLDLVQILLFGWVLRRNGCRLRLKTLNFSLVGRILQYCAPMAVFILLNTLNRDLDKYLVTLWTDTQTLAVYANASKVLPFDIVMTSFCTVLLPKITHSIAEKDHAGAARLYRLFLQIAYTSTGILCCAALAAAPQLMELLYSEKYLAGLSIFCVYILVDLLRFTNITLILSAAGKTARLMVLGLCSLGANALLNVVLYRVMGLPGPAVATLVTTLLTGIVMLLLGARELHTTIRGLFDLRHLLVFVLESLVLCLAFWGVQYLLTWLRVPYVWTLVLTAGGYGILMLVLQGRKLLQILKQVNKA